MVAFLMRRNHPDPVGPASFIVMAANYSSSALICTCQVSIFEISTLTFNTMLSHCIRLSVSVKVH